MEKIKKKCGKCGDEKLLLNFYKFKYSKDGHKSICSDCSKSYNTLYLSKDNNRDKLKDKSLKWKYNNKDKNTIYQKNYKETHKKETKTYMCVWRENNKEKISTYYDNNPHKFAFRRLLRHTLERLNKKKEGKTIDILGYSALDLKNHITSLFTEGMSWDNYGEWHIDHIKPVSKFDKNTAMNVVNALNNLQPLWATTREINGVTYEGNLNKYNKY